MIAVEPRFSSADIRTSLRSGLTCDFQRERHPFGHSRAARTLPKRHWHGSPDCLTLSTHQAQVPAPLHSDESVGPRRNYTSNSPYSHHTNKPVPKTGDTITATPEPYRGQSLLLLARNTDIRSPSRSSFAAIIASFCPLHQRWDRPLGISNRRTTPCKWALGTRDLAQTKGEFHIQLQGRQGFGVTEGGHEAKGRLSWLCHSLGAPTTSLGSHCLYSGPTFLRPSPLKIQVCELHPYIASVRQEHLPHRRH